MKYFRWMAVLLLIAVAAPASASEVACGPEPLAVTITTPQDAPTQLRMARLLAEQQESYLRCIHTLDAMRKNDRSRGLDDVPFSPSAPAPLVLAHKLAPATPPFFSSGFTSSLNECSVLDDHGLPCVSKSPGAAPDSMVYSNRCPATLEVAVTYADLSRGLVTVKSKSTASMSCANCGLPVSLEARCR
jgi:hypothetical protein